MATATDTAGTYEIYVPITKTEKTEDGDLIVWGKATGPDLDLDQQICDPAWLAKAMPAWFEWGNIRSQHGNVAAGVGFEMESTDGGDYYVKSLIVDRDAIRKVEKKVYKGYSIGITNGRLAKDKAAPKGRIVDGDIPEVSLVDRPCNPTAKMGIAKAYGGHMAPMDIDGEVDVEATVKTVDASAATEADEMTVETTVVLDGKVIAEKAVAPTVRSTRIMTPRAHRAAVETMEKALAGEFGKAGVLLKAAGVNDESGDIAGAWAAIAMIADLIISEATELKTGRGEEIYDIKILSDAVCSLKYFISEEMYQDGKPAGPFQPDDSPTDMADTISSIDMAAEPTVVKTATVDADGVETEPDFLAEPESVVKEAPAEVVAVVEPVVEPVADTVAVVEPAEPVDEIVKTKWNQAKRDAAEAAGHAMPGGKYPIEDASDVEDAVGLVGNGTAPKKKIRAHIMAQAKRIGAEDKIPDSWNPNTSGKAIGADLDKQLDVDEPKINDVPTAAFDKSAVAEMLNKAVTEAIAPLEAKLAFAEGELAKVLRTAIPGGPVIIAPPQPVAAINSKADRAEYLRQQAELTGDPTVASAYRAKAREVESTKD